MKLEVARVKPGQNVSVKILRDGETKNLRVTVNELPGSDQLAKADSKAGGDDSEALKGVAVTDLSREARRQFDIPENVKGALVAEVEADSAAREAGLKPGDVILEINRKPVRGAEDAVKLTENPKDKTTLLRVWSNGGTRYVVVDESKAG